MNVENLEIPGGVKMCFFCYMFFVVTGRYLFFSVFLVSTMTKKIGGTYI